MKLPTLPDAQDVRAAARRLDGVVRRTPLEAFATPDSRVELRVKLECLQETNSFKARGAWNQIEQLDAAARAGGVVASSSGNHGRALAWAAERAGVQATIVMPADAYPNKIQACRDHGAKVVLARDRMHADELCAQIVSSGASLVHPYDAARTIAGAGTVGLELAGQWPELEVALLPVGGGGMLAGSALALRAELGSGVAVFGVEPEGAPTLTLALKNGAPVRLERISTCVQGLCPPSLGTLNLEVCRANGVRAIALTDEEILSAQRELVRRGGWTVEPAGAAAVAAVLARRLPAELLRGRTAANPLRVAAVVSGGNPDPAQLESVR
jgi:threonine dehydratase